ncbi:hypothetical protein CDD83_9287 [Cordyceps sp. RAO-2017]|nr:hypothetical protein CDD83_9287 [Cordyceps sp. RAO-2017]
MAAAPQEERPSLLLALPIFIVITIRPVHCDAVFPHGDWTRERIRHSRIAIAHGLRLRVLVPPHVRRRGPRARKRSLRPRAVDGRRAGGLSPAAASSLAPARPPALFFPGRAASPGPLAAHRRLAALIRARGPEQKA